MTIKARGRPEATLPSDDHASGIGNPEALPQSQQAVYVAECDRLIAQRRAAIRKQRGLPVEEQ